MLILLLHPKAEIRELLIFPIESKFSAKVEAVENTELAIKALEKKDVKYDFVILDNQPDTVRKIISALQRKLPQPYVVLCDPDPLQAKINLTGCNLLGVAKYDSLVKDINSLLSEATLEKESEEGYARIGLNLLAKLKSLEAAIFVRLSAKHYVKVFHPGDIFERADLDRFAQKKNLSHLFLPNADTGKFITRFDSLLQNLLAQKDLNMQGAKDSIVDSIDTIQELIQKFGVTPEVQKTVKSTVAVTLKALGDFPQLTEMVNDLESRRDQYVSAHSLQLAHIACAMAVAADWYSESTFEKLSLAAFLHDLPMRDDKLCAVPSYSALVKRAQEFSPKQIEDYRQHTERAAELARKFPESPSETDQIIAQHHERPDGSGFPNGVKAAQLSPLSSLFIVAHDYLDFIGTQGAGASMADFLTLKGEEYAQGNFKKIAKAIAGMKI